MRYIYFITLLILGSATFGSAQFDNVSDGCKTQLTQLIADKDVNACFPFVAAGSFVSGGGNGLVDANNTDALKSLADSVCGLPKCSDDLVSQTQTKVKNACQTDLAAKQKFVTLINGILSVYSPTRDSMCFKNSTGGYCFIESDIAASQVLQSAPKDQSPAITFASAPRDVVCTPCNKAIVNSYVNYLNSHPNALSELNVTNDDYNAAENVIKRKCSQSFIDGNVGDSAQSPQTFQQNLPTENKSSDSTQLIVNRMGYITLIGFIIFMLY